MTALLLSILVALGAPDLGVTATVDGGPPPKLVATGAPPVATLKCSPSPARIADRVECSVEITHRAEVGVTVGAPAGATAERSTPAETLPDGRLKTTRRFTLQQMELKDIIIGELRVDWRDAAGGESVVIVPGTRIKITSVIGSATDPKFRTYTEPQVDAEPFWDRHGGLPLRVFHTPAFVVVMVLLGGILGAALFFLLRRFFKKEPEIVEWVDPRPAHVIAFEKLDLLEAEDLPGKGEVKAYYTRLSEAVRFYLELRYRFGALEMTSDEIGAQIERLALSGDARVGIHDFLGESDLVKFAGFSPDQSAIDTIMRLARGLIELTRVVDDLTPAEPDKTSGGDS